MDHVPTFYQDHPQLLSYYEKWQRDAGSIIFVPLARLLKDEGFLEEARKVCEKGLESSPGLVSGRLVLASVYWELGKEEEAKRIAQAILEQMPEHSEARKYVRGVQKRSPAPDLWQTKTMVDILMGQGAYSEATDILRQLIKKEPKNRKLRQKLIELEEAMTGEEKTVI